MLRPAAALAPARVPAKADVKYNDYFALSGSELDNNDNDDNDDNDNDDDDNDDNVRCDPDGPPTARQETSRVLTKTEVEGWD